MQAARQLICLSAALGLCAGQPATDPGAHLLELSVVGVQLGFQVWVPRPLIEVRAHPGASCVCAQAAGPLLRVRAHPGFLLWAPSPLIWMHARLQVSPGAAYPVVRVQGLRGEGRQRPGCLRESSN